MNKIFSLIKATMTENMSLFKYKSKSKKNKLLIPLFIFVLIFFTMWSYANSFFEPLNKIGMEHVGLMIFVSFCIILTIIEGIYKSGDLLFNCKDDDMLFSLPIKRGTILFIRVFKFYVFEVIFNSLFLVPAMVAYVRWHNVEPTYYLVAVISLLVIPMIPIAFSCIIGLLISFFSTRFKKKNLIQIVITLIFSLGIMYFSFNFNSLISNISQNASGIGAIISKIYYPAELFIRLIIKFNIVDLLLFIGINVVVLGITVLILSKFYFKVNTSVKSIKIKHSTKKVKFKVNNQTSAIINKEFNRFSTSPVFVINAGLGLVLMVIGCIIFSLKFEDIANPICMSMNITIEQLKAFIPLILFIFVVFASLTSSITSSMISLEGRTFNILKSLPIDAYKIIKAKVLTAVLIVIPFLLVGNVIIFTRFSFNILEIILILITSIVLPFVAEKLGIIFNLKYPKMDASNDTEVVKQSISSSLSVFVGMGLIGVTALAGFNLANMMPIDAVIGIILAVYILINLGATIYLKRIGAREFNEINV